MPLKNISDSSDADRVVGVVGAGSFGTAIANILAEKSHVLIYTRKAEKVTEINEQRISAKQEVHSNITAVSDLQEIAEKCNVIFPIVPSAAFRETIRQLSPYLKPYHILIHGTKGLDFHVPEGTKINEYNPVSREHVKTMSEVIIEESSVLRVGCLAGPNLAKEMAARQPAASVVASHFDEVIDIGQRLLRNERFLIYGSSDLIGIELCGVLKNIIAIGAGAIAGLGLGENAKSLLISRGIVEMVQIGKTLGGNAEAFLGLAGIGDLVATCNSSLSRNYTVGYRLAHGEHIEDILSSMDEVAEGVKTIDIINTLSKTYKVRCPITESLYKILKREMTVEDANSFLMKFPFRAEIDFL
ncbi:MAG: NAD(P)H-dependent glycerol-3-phosphate dehydrogenase [Bacteroidota bacterium]